MADDVEILKEQAARYRRLMISVSDQRARDALSGLIAEIEAALVQSETHPITAAAGHQEALPKAKNKRIGRSPSKATER